MKNPDGSHQDSTDEEDRDGIRERPGDLKDDGQTRERTREGAWNPDEDGADSADRAGNGGPGRDSGRESARDR